MNQQPQNESAASNGELHKEFLDGLGNVDSRLGDEKNKEPLAQAMADGKPAEIIPPATEDNYFRKVLPSLLAATLDLSKQAGWKSPAVEPILTEEMWIEQVSDAASHTIEKYIPNAASKFDSEIVLIGLVVPWFAMNMYDMIVRMRTQREKKPGEETPSSTKPADQPAPPGIDLGLHRNRENDMATAALGR